MRHIPNTYTITFFLDFLWKQCFKLMFLYITLLLFFGMHHLRFFMLLTEALVICSQLVLNYRHVLAHPPTCERAQKEPTLLKKNVLFGIYTFMLHLSTTLLSIMHYVHFIGLIAYAFILIAHYQDNTPVYKEQFKNVAHIDIPGYINLPLGLYYGQCIDAWDASPCSISNIISALDALLLVYCALYLLPYTANIIQIFHSTIISVHILYYTLTLLTLTLFIPQLIHLMRYWSAHPPSLPNSPTNHPQNTPILPEKILSILRDDTNILTNTIPIILPGSTLGSIEDSAYSSAVEVMCYNPAVTAKIMTGVVSAPFRH